MDFLSMAPFSNPYPTGADYSSATGEPTAAAAINPNSHYPQPKRSVGRPKGSKNKPKPLSQSFLTSPSLNSTEVLGITTGGNHILRRGRPKGSKNKPKKIEPPVDTKPDTKNIIEIPAGTDIMQHLLQYCHQYNASITVLNASGELSNIVPYYQPHVPMPGPFTIGSFSCTILPPPPQEHFFVGTTKSEETRVPFVVSLSSRNGGIVCSGMVGKSAVAASKVEVVVVVMTTITTSGVNFANNGCTDNSGNDNKGKEEIAPPVTNLLTLQDLKNLTFREFYNYCNPDYPLENLLTVKLNSTFFDDDAEEI